ncbi:MAG: Fe-S protein assembly co-chaperone HscB [Gammaproteobacteria bacterium]|nr:Fe-S protein assembly co-chaperone HscB [Gammaproteobacteria bacterium]
MNLNNHYQLLGLELDYQIDKKVLTENYRQLQRSVHPDNYANQSDRDKRLSVQKSSQINDAFQTIKDPLKRAIYHLSLLGITLQDNATTSDGAFLMAQMESREQLEKIKSIDNPELEIEKLLKSVNTKIDAEISSLIELFKIASETDKKIISSIKDAILKLQFHTKLRTECELLEEELLNF